MNKLGFVLGSLGMKLKVVCITFMYFGDFVIYGIVLSKHVVCMIRLHIHMSCGL
jgi:hypothetical protein